METLWWKYTLSTPPPKKNYITMPESGDEDSSCQKLDCLRFLKQTESQRAAHFQLSLTLVRSVPYLRLSSSRVSLWSSCRDTETKWHQTRVHVIQVCVGSMCWKPVIFTYILQRLPHIRWINEWKDNEPTEDRERRWWRRGEKRERKR